MTGNQYDINEFKSILTSLNKKIDHSQDQSERLYFKKNPEFISSIKEFYSVAGSLSPKEIFAKMEMDITKPEFWQSGIDEIKELLKETKKLAKKLGKI